ncbi:glutathione hydrolase 3-like protein [Tanacetum coccineum]|uniref:Glutathione hydrolase 3-like protein n=1 Tax=Tanacetum coccineum TaxID=301880 RepID=A0ABQ4YT22_9ASTR
MQVTNILESYENTNAANGSLGLHRSFEALKHMCALRMSLGDPDFVNVITTVANMISPAFAKNIQERLFYNTTFPSTYYMPRLLIAVESVCAEFQVGERMQKVCSAECVYMLEVRAIGSRVFGRCGEEMCSVSVRASPCDGESSECAESIFPRSESGHIDSASRVHLDQVRGHGGMLCGKSGLYSGCVMIGCVCRMQRVGVALCCGPGEQSELVVSRRGSSRAVIDGDHIELSEDRKKFLVERGHELEPKAGGAICQLVIQTLKKPNVNRKLRHDQKEVLKGMLTAVSDPRKDGRPAAC